MPSVSGMSRVAKTETDSYGFFSQNIEAGKEHNFDQHITDGDDVGPYDFGSIMHYDRIRVLEERPAHY